MLRTGGFFAIAMILCIGAAFYAYSSVQSEQMRSAEAAHAQEVLLRLEEIHSTVRDLVANARGYSLSGRHEYLLRFEDDRNMLSEMLDSLSLVQRGNPAQLDRLVQLNAAIGKRVALARSLIESDRNAPSSNFLERGRELNDDIRKQITALKQGEQDIAARRAADSQSSAQWALLTIFCSGVISVAVLLFGYWRVQQDTLASREADIHTQLVQGELDRLYNQAACGYFSLAQKDRAVTRINDTQLGWLGYQRDQMPAKLTQAELLTPASAQYYEREVWPQIVTGTAVRDVELEMLCADGRSLAVLLDAHASVQDDSGALHSRNTVRDISALRQVRKELQQNNAALEHQTQQLANITKELASFAYSVSHDLRAPLRAISGYSMMLEEDFTEALGDKGQELLQVICKNVKKMDTLINDLLKLSKSATADLTLGNFSMQELVGQVADSLRKEHGKVEFIIDGLDDAPASPQLLTQVWQNLLDNAVKFSAKNAQPQIRVSSQSTAQEVVYQVQDNGVGFDMRYVHKLFGIFQRLHRQEEFPGTGIGLALIQRIVMRHGGRVWAQSTLGEGASFYFALPRTVS